MKLDGQQQLMEVSQDHSQQMADIRAVYNAATK